MARLRAGCQTIASVALLLGLLASCTRAPLKEQVKALRLTSAPDLSDDLPLEPLLAAVETEIAFLEKAQSHKPLLFGQRTYSQEEYLTGLRHFVELAKQYPVRDEFFSAVKKDFDFYEVYGDKAWGEIFLTSYYSPVVPGSLKRTEKFTQALYKQPDDMISLDLAAFDKDKYALDRKLRGRIVDKKLVPYYSREDIDSKGALKGRKLELAWVDPIDSFMIQVQGSATVDFGKGKTMRVAYADKNGQPYEPVGKFVKQFIPPEQMSLQAIENYLHTLPPEKMQDYLNKNPSYVFFTDSAAAPATSLGVPPTDGRTAAVDQRFFPKGALAFLVTVKPKFANATDYFTKDWEPLTRFVLDQDIGGAITGGGRLDLYWGSGPEAKRNAGVMKQAGKLYYLAPKPGMDKK